MYRVEGRARLLGSQRPIGDCILRANRRSPYRAALPKKEVPLAPTPAPAVFRARIPVRFNDIDRAGIVYYPNYFHYYHMAFEDFFAAAHGLPYPAWFDERGIGFPTVHVEGDFESPLRYGDELEVELSVIRVGEASVEFAFRAVSPPPEGSDEAPRVAGRARITKVCVGLESVKPQPIPDDLRVVLDRYRQDAS